jgi:intracellular sulfur oxidation DsrE/DsrF family protein
MMKGRILAIAERAYRGTVEEQYANILWLSHVLRRLRGEIDVLLLGNAVRYALQDQPRTQLVIGSRLIDTLPHYETEVRTLLDAGVSVYVSAADCDRCGIDRDRLIPAVVAVNPPDVARLFAEHARVWHW